MDNVDWMLPPRHLVLEEDEIHVWRAQLSIQEEYIQALERILATDERTRAGQFHFAKHRMHFIAARGILRLLLGLYLDLNPSLLQFHYNQYGKPFLYNVAEDKLLSFNVTHSHEIALYAITRSEREVGIDIEYIQPARADLSIAERFFSRYEADTLRLLPREQQPLAFFHYWTRKEAYIKARGLGLSLDLNLFDVSHDEPARLLHTREEGQNITAWSLHNLTPDPEYAAALAVQGSPHRLVYWQWPSQQHKRS